MQLYDKDGLNDLQNDQWEFNAYSDFKSIVTDDKVAFPCTLGVAGFSANQLRFHFISAPLGTDRAAVELAAALQSFIPNARSFGKNTSLVIFFKETRDLGTDAYEKIFWSILNKLHRLDARPWPKDIPAAPDERMWEFSFAGEPIFVVCNTPSHRERRSRYSKNFMITFQPRWVFEGVIGEGAPNSDRIKREIRRRLAIFDTVEPSPDLGGYREESNREWKQYFLQENNAPRIESCPFHSKLIERKPEIIATDHVQLEEVVANMLPPTGSVEVQFDTPYRAHIVHVHPVDETLHIIQGGVTFEYGDNTVECTPGDRLLLPANTPHASKAGKDGCLYVIATRLVAPSMSKENLQESQDAQ
jgi:FPC/CPF motif-containing protein YcgG/quercetin dioxygenase-like cupin family protein